MSRKFTLALMVAVLATAFRPFPLFDHTTNISIAVGKDGYNHRADYSVEVQAGHEVTITFTHADAELSVDNPYEIQIVGLGLDLPTVIVSRDHPVASITFTPTRPGNLRILCIIPGIGTDQLVSGVVNVVLGEQAGALTMLSMEFEPRDDGSALARVRLHDGRGNPIGKVPVNFTLLTAVGGELDLGAPITIEDGTAVIQIPATAGQELRVAAQFEGQGGFVHSEAFAEFTASGAPMEYASGALSSPTPPLLLAAVLILVLVGVWATYLSVVYQVFQIKRN